MLCLRERSRDKQCNEPWVSQKASGHSCCSPSGWLWATRLISLRLILIPEQHADEGALKGKEFIAVLVTKPHWLGEDK